MKTHHYISWPVFLVFSTGSSLSDQITQVPTHTFKNPGETVEFSCSHSIQSYNRILWYKQTKNNQMQLLGHMTGDSGLPETGLNVTLDGSANKDQTCTLTVKGLSLSSSAVYFCAACYHSASYLCSSVQKPPDHCSTSPTAPSSLHLYSVL